MKQLPCLLSMVVVCFFGATAFAQDAAERLDALENAVKSQTRTIEEQQKTIDSLKDAIDKQKSQEEPALSSKVSGFFGGSFLTNPNISLVVDTFAYTSNLKNEELEARGIPGFTTNGLESRKGFNLRSAELFLFAPVDPYFNLYGAFPITEEGIELEEAYAVTTSLPAGLQVKGGKFKSNFSRLDAQHPHVWDFADIALPYRAFLGDEGLGGEKGVQLTWLPALPFYLQLGAELLQGENDLLFGSDARSGPHAFSFFAKSSLDTSDFSSLYFGPSVLYGKTKSSSILPADETSGNTFDLRGNSTLYGMEAVWKWKSGRRGVTLQGEYLYLAQNGDLTEFDPAGAEVGSAGSLKRHQDGAYLQALYQCGRWRLGARYDALELFADTFKLADTQQDLGKTPWRATGAIEFNPSEFSRFRFQYTHDRSGRDGRDNDEWWLQFIVGIGAHAAHAF